MEAIRINRGPNEKPLHHTPFRPAVSCLVLALALAGTIDHLLARRNGTLIPYGDSVVGTTAPCQSCHSDFQINQGGSVTLNGLPAVFEAGTTYDLSLTLTGGPGNAIGTQIVAMHDDSSAAGTLTPVSSGLTTHTYSQKPVPILTHSSPLASRTINFRWTAPSNPNGPVTFRFAANSANNNFNPGGDLILYGTIATQPAAAAEDTPSLFFAQLLNGVAGGTPNRSRIILRNGSGTAVSGQIRFRDAAGDPLDLPFGGVPLNSVDFALSPWGSQELETDGSGTLQVGAAEILVSSGIDSNLEGTLIYSLLGRYVSLPGSRAEREQQVYASVTPAERTGIAFYNPDSNSSSTLQLTLLDSAGASRATRTLTLQPQHQLARFLDEADLFQSFFAGFSGSFQGSVNIRVSTGEDIALVGLIQKRADGALIAVSPSSHQFTPAP